MRVSGLGRAANRAENGGIEIAGQAVEALFDWPLVIPAQANIESQLGSDAPVILRVNTNEALRKESAGIHGNIAARGQAEQKGGKSGPVAGAATDGGLLTCPHAAEVEPAASITKTCVSLLQNPVFATVTEGMVAVDVGE